LEYVRTRQIIDFTFEYGFTGVFGAIFGTSGVFFGSFWVVVDMCSEVGVNNVLDELNEALS